MQPRRPHRNVKVPISDSSDAPAPAPAIAGRRWPGRSSAVYANSAVEHQIFLRTCRGSEKGMIRQRTGLLAARAWRPRAWLAGRETETAAQPCSSFWGFLPGAATVSAPSAHSGPGRTTGELGCVRPGVHIAGREEQRRSAALVPRVRRYERHPLAELAKEAGIAPRTLQRTYAK